MVNGAYNLERFVRILESFGLTDVMLPFLLVFTVLFAMLRKSNILGRKNYDLIVSIILGLLVVIPHVLGVYPAGSDPVSIINQALPSIVVVIVAVLMVLLIIGIFGGKPQWVGGATGFVAILSFIIVLYIFGSAAGWWANIPSNYFSDEAIAIVIILLVFGFIIAFITGEDAPSDTEGTFKSLGRGLQELFGGR